MKFSMFNIWAIVNNRIIIFNTLTQALASFDQKHVGDIEIALTSSDVSRIPKEFVEDMFEDGYLVKENQDELGAVEEAVTDRRSRRDEHSLCVMLNKVCNFDCSYCFQLHNGRILSKSGINRITNLFQNILLTARKIELDWFGGEPLLSFAKLRELNELFFALAEEKKVPYSFSITTNGYLLNTEVLSYLRKRRPTQLTITLDGPPDVHDKSRPLKNGQGTFWVILENVKQAIASGLEITLRVNISKDNVGRVPELFDILVLQGLKNWVRVNLQPVVSSEAHPCEEGCLTGYSSAHSILSIYLEQVKKGWKSFPLLENLRVLGFCIGEYPNRIVTDLDCRIYCCTQMAEGEAIGEINESGQVVENFSEMSRWVAKNPLDFPECRVCSILPICMGGCNMKRALKNQMDYCLDWKHDLPTLLEILVLSAEDPTLSSLTGSS